MNLIIRRAIPSEHQILTQIAFAAKRYWGYPQSYFEVWKDELTITPAYIEQNVVFAAQINNTVVGFCSIVYVEKDFYAGEVFVQKGHWLEHIFIEPAYINKGIGTELMRFFTDYAKQKNILSLLIFSDPHASGFYRKLGASYKSDSPSSIAGRNVSLFELTIKQG